MLPVRKSSLPVCFILLILGLIGFSCGNPSGNPVGSGIVFPEGWTAAENNTFGGTLIMSVAWGEGIFVAVNAPGAVAHSTDGKTWNQVNPDAFDFSVSDIAWGDGTFVAVGSTKIAHSADGINWTTLPSTPFGAGGISAVCFGSGRFVAVSSPSSGGKMAYSADGGKTWTLANNSPFTNGISAVCYGNGTFIAGGGSAGTTVKLAYSADNGETWTALKNTTTEYRGSCPIDSLAYGNGIFVAGTTNSDEISYSNNGISWTRETSPADTSPAKVIAWGNSRFAAAVDYGRKIMSSRDGKTWTEEAGGIFGSGSIYDIAFGNGIFVAVGSNGKIAYSK